MVIRLGRVEPSIAPLSFKRHEKQQPSSRAEHAMDTGKDLGRLPCVFERMVADDHIDAAVHNGVRRGHKLNAPLSHRAFQEFADVQTHLSRALK